MKRIELGFGFSEYESAKELHESERSLLEISYKASDTAYAPYSLFRVGAAVELNNGEIVSGSNQENIAYPSGLCAERVAVYAAMSRFPEASIKRIAISTSGEKHTSKFPAAPCGSCRQAILEYELNQDYEIELILGNPTGIVRVIKGVKNLLPLYFFEESLRNKGEQ